MYSHLVDAHIIVNAFPCVCVCAPAMCTYMSLYIFNDQFINIYIFLSYNVSKTKLVYVRIACYHIIKYKASKSN